MGPYIMYIELLYFYMNIYSKQENVLLISCIQNYSSFSFGGHAPIVVLHER